MKRNLSGGSMLLFATIYNSLNLVLLIKANFGVSTLSSVPLTIQTILPNITIGTWTTIVQILAMLVMLSLTKKIRIGYLLSFLVAVIYGFGVDGFTLLLNSLPTELGFRIVYMVLGLVGTAIGSAVFMLCEWPILPYDLVVREISLVKKISVKKTRTIYDILSLSISIVLSFLFIGNYKSIGFVTVIGVFFMGNLTGYFVDVIREKINVKQYTKIGKLISTLT